jgi:pimeloyl-ACP methyl ester carboxylesterase
MTTRGSGFTDFAFTTLTLGNLMVALLFFLAPSRAMRIMTAVVALFLFVDMIIILAVSHIRKEEGWVGLASIIWAFLMAVWSIVVDRVVAWGKKEEEERLTGRAESRRTLKEWLAVLAATIILVIFVIIVVFMTGCISIRARDATLDSKMWGDRYSVDGNKYEVHLACVGDAKVTKEGLPVTTVILEGGENPVEYELQPWLHETYVNGTIDRYCFWDRPGFAWSDNAPSPHSAGMSADVLYEALRLSGEDGPWVVMSAGTGTLVSRIFAGIHSQEVKGLMLVDPLHEDLLNRLSSPSRGFFLWLRGVISPLGIQRLGGALFKGRNRADRVYGRNAYQTGKYIKAQLQENLVADSLTKSEVKSSRNTLHEDIPLVVVSSGTESRKDSIWKEKQEDLTKLTDELLSWDVVSKAPHEVWRTYEGRRIMEKRLGQLVKRVNWTPSDITDEDY